MKVYQPKKAIFNNTLVSYLFDTGAQRTIINESLYVRLKREDPSTELLKYNGRALFSCNKKLTIYGVVYLRQCKLTDKSNDLLKDVPIIVTNHKSKHECLLGRDLMKKVPCFHSQVTDMDNKIKTSSEHLTKIHNG